MYLTPALLDMVFYGPLLCYFKATATISVPTPETASLLESTRDLPGYAINKPLSKYIVYQESTMGMTWNMGMPWNTTDTRGSSDFLKEARLAELLGGSTKSVHHIPRQAPGWFYLFHDYFIMIENKLIPYFWSWLLTQWQPGSQPSPRRGLGLGWEPGPWFNIKMLSYRYGKSHLKDRMILWPSYL